MPNVHTQEPTPPVIVRRPTSGDADAVRELHERAFPEGVAYAPVVLDHILSRGAATSLVAESDGRPVAFAGAMEDGRGGARLWTIHVDDGHRGRGIASRLLAELEDVCRARRLDRIDLQVWRGNDAAIALYERHGFEVVGEETASFGSFDPPGALIMSKRLVDAAP